MGICEDTSIFKESILISCRMMSESLLGNVSQNPAQILSFTSQPAGFSRLLQIHTSRGKDKKKHAFTFIITKRILLVKILHTLTLPYSSLFFPYSSHLYLILLIPYEDFIYSQLHTNTHLSLTF